MKTIIQKGEKDLKQRKLKTLTIVETIGVSCTYILIHKQIYTVIVLRP